MDRSEYRDMSYLDQSEISLLLRLTSFVKVKVVRSTSGEQTRGNSRPELYPRGTVQEDFIGYYLEILRYYKEVFRQRRIIVDDMGAADGPLCMDSRIRLTKTELGPVVNFKLNLKGSSAELKLIGDLGLT
uniref:Uncharacterized protein n=1 Tax=Vespula pensylvanica TaxID=30213 RepID=A0A834PFM0_VESPE|nr:hypothetical protein H0235_000672 [Vespula pensylvanica]